jgi:hypothetical protein
VISVEGRTHPVSTHFLEDVYEKMEYCLALDSPASGAYFAQHGEKVSLCSIFILSVIQIYQPLEPLSGTLLLEPLTTAALYQLLYLVNIPCFQIIDLVFHYMILLAQNTS